MDLRTFRRNIYSQNGEDGVLLELLRRLHMDDDGDHWCVEFGAWDGKYLSNTFNLVESHGWNAIYVEGDERRFQDLEATAETHPKVRTLLKTVGGPLGGGSSLDDLLAEFPLPKTYDLLSIDIDSSDLDVWARHVNYRPCIVVIEINSSIEPGIVQWHSEYQQGNSFSATMKVAINKRYTLVCHTGNLLFVANELVDFVGLDELDVQYPERMFMWDWVRARHPSFSRRLMFKITKRLPQPVKRLLAKLIRRAKDPWSNTCS